MTSAFTLEREAIAARLTAAGVADVALDRGQAPPFVLVGMPTGVGPVAGVGVGAWRCEYPVTVVWLGPGDTVNAGWALDQVQAILLELGPAAFRPTTFGDDDQPAYQLTYTRDVPNPNC